MKRLKVAYITTYDARDVNAWSGLSFYISKVLEKYVGEIEYICNLNLRPDTATRLNKIRHKLFGNKQYFLERTESVGKHYAKQIEKRIKHKNFDLIFSPGTIPIAFLETNIPIIFWTDATFASLLGYYFDNVSDETIKDGNKMEYEALNRCRIAIYSSDWAANSAINDYRINPDKVKVIPFGANIEKLQMEGDRVKRIGKPIKLLFVGKDWERKGGKIAIDSLLELNYLGVEAELTIVGSEPPDNFNHPKLFSHKYLDKNKIEEANILDKLYEDADFFLLPTRKECYGVVFCEANSFGLPILTTNTGGIPTIVQDGINGFKLPLSATGEDYARLIKGIIMNQDLYKQLRINSRIRYNEILNWESAGKKISKFIEMAL